jgi:uncharacterized glyoxalase superfamily protein PhnB
MTSQLGWTQDFATPEDSGDKLVAVSLDGARVMLGPADERWLPPASRDHRGAGVTVFIELSSAADIDAIHDKHAAGGVVTVAPSDRPFGARPLSPAGRHVPRKRRGPSIGGGCAAMTC